MLFMLYWIPLFASLVLLVVARVNDVISGVRALPFVGWFIVAVILQFFTASLAAWATGLALQALLGVVLAVKIRVQL